MVNVEILAVWILTVTPRIISGATTEAALTKMITAKPVEATVNVPVDTVSMVCVARPLVMQGALRADRFIPVSAMVLVAMSTAAPTPITVASTKVRPAVVKTVLVMEAAVAPLTTTVQPAVLLTARGIML